MYKSKAILLLKTFSKEELSRFSDFLKSPYFNTNTRVLKLFEELKKYHPDYKSKGVGKENLYKKIFPGKEYNEQILKNLISELLKSGKDFLSVNSFIQNPSDKALALISQLTTRDALQLFNKETENLGAAARESEAFSAMTYYWLFQLEEEKFRNNIYNNKQAVASENLVGAGNYLSLFFLINIFRLSINRHINRFSFNVPDEESFSDKLLNSFNMDEIIRYMEGKNFEKTLSIKLLYYAYVSNHDINDDGSYKIYRKLLFENIRTFKKEEAHMFFQFLESICAQKINSGRHEYYKDLYETYELELVNKVYKPREDVPLTVMKFRNIYLTGMRVGKYDWAESFINNYKKELMKENRQNITELSLAQLNFEKKDFNKTLSHLQKVRTSEIYFKVDVKTLNLMTLYELGHYESALSLIESFKRTLNNNELLTEQYRLKNINFINSVSSLIKISIDGDAHGAQKFNEKVNSYSELGNKKWLMRKIDELNNRMRLN